jgi:putative ABC transport system permease protein
MNPAETPTTPGSKRLSGFRAADGRRCLVAFLGNRVSALALRTGPAWLGFGAAFFVLAAFSSIAPEITSRFSRAVRATIHQKIEPRLAAQNLGRTLLRNSVTIASLAAAVAMTVGVAVMVFSFRQTVGDWIIQTLVADLFIGPAAN